MLELRYGLGGERPRTLDEVGRTFNVTRERIRQIETQSLKKLQNLPEAQKLRDDVEIASGFCVAHARAPFRFVAARRQRRRPHLPLSQLREEAGGRTRDS